MCQCNLVHSVIVIYTFCRIACSFILLTNAVKTPTNPEMPNALICHSASVPFKEFSNYAFNCSVFFCTGCCHRRVLHITLFSQVSNISFQTVVSFPGGLDNGVSMCPGEELSFCESETPMTQPEKLGCCCCLIMRDVSVRGLLCYVLPFESPHVLWQEG